ncbi:hypothetical protein D3C87_325320 [compost metagenome]
MNKTSNQIEAMLKEYLISSGAENEWYDEDEEEDIGEDLVHCFLNNDLITTVEGGRLEYVCGKGGGEGQGEHVEAVFKFDNVFYKATWAYYSHYGYSWDSLDFVEVVPREQLVTVYDEV